MDFKSFFEGTGTDDRGKSLLYDASQEGPSTSA